MKYLATNPLDGDTLPFQAFQHTQNHFFFVKKNEPRACYVTPYIIITDGKDILSHNSQDGQTEIGFRFNVMQPNNLVWNKSPEKFNEIVENAVKCYFKNLFPNILTRHGNDINGLDQPIGKITELDSKLIKVHPTHCGSYNLTKRKFIPVYFVVLPNHCVLSFETSPDTPPCFTADFRVLSAFSDNLNLSFVSRAILKMIQSGEILFPITSERRGD